MRVGMGLIKNEHGVFHVRRKVPKALEVATARAMGVPKERVSWLKETLGTKDEKQAKVLAKPVMMKFDRILAQAEALLVEHPVRTELTEAEIKRIADYYYDAASGVRFLTVIEDEEASRSLKTETSVRAVPIHPELVRIGFIEFVDQVRSNGGQSARLFPKLQQGSKGGFGEAFSKWFGRYKRSLGIDNEKSVFHSFRHGFKDALRAAGVNEDVNDALTGHSGGNAVARGYGSDDMVRRFGFHTLCAAVEKARYSSLDLSHLQWAPPAKSKHRER